VLFFNTAELYFLSYDTWLWHGWAANAVISSGSGAGFRAEQREDFIFRSFLWIWRWHGNRSTQKRLNTEIFQEFPSFSKNYRKSLTNLTVFMDPFPLYLQLICLIYFGFRLQEKALNSQYWSVSVFLNPFPNIFDQFPVFRKSYKLLVCWMVYFFFVPFPHNFSPFPVFRKRYKFWVCFLLFLIRFRIFLIRCEFMGKV